MNKKSIIMIVAIIIVLAMIGVLVFGYVQKWTSNVQNPVATITVEGYDEPIVVELYPDQALNTVKNFIALSNNGFYNGLIFHRVEKDFVIQGGDPNGDGSGGPTLSAIDTSIEKGSDADKEYEINGEFKLNGYDNKIKHEKGVISMARSDYGADIIEEGYNSGGSQFFICLADSPGLNGSYAAFGKVISGMDTVDKISQVELAKETDEETGEETETSKPAQDVKISSITVETYGIDYGMPETHDAFDYNSWLMSKYNFSY